MWTVDSLKWNENYFLFRPLNITLQSEGHILCLNISVALQFQISSYYIPRAVISNHYLLLGIPITSVAWHIMLALMSLIHCHCISCAPFMEFMFRWNFSSNFYDCTGRLWKHLVTFHVHMPNRLSSQILLLCHIQGHATNEQGCMCCLLVLLLCVSMCVHVWETDMHHVHIFREHLYLSLAL